MAGIALLMGTAALSGCDGLFTEECVYKGYVHAKNEFRIPSGIEAPAHTEMNLLVYPRTGNGVVDYENLIVPFSPAGDAYETLHIGDYDFLAYNKGGNILELGNAPEEARLRVPTAKGKITLEQQAVYSCSVSGTIRTDDTLHIACPSQLLVQKIIFNITVTGVPDIIRYDSINAELDGVTTSRHIQSRRKGNDFATLPFTAFPQKKNFFRREVLVFGINTGGTNLIRMQLRGNMPVSAETDLSGVFKNFEADGISVDITVRVSPSLHTATATIENWQDIDWGDIPVIN